MRTSWHPHTGRTPGARGGWWSPLQCPSWCLPATSQCLRRPACRPSVPMLAVGSQARCGAASARCAGLGVSARSACPASCVCIPSGREDLSAGNSLLCKASPISSLAIQLRSRFGPSPGILYNRNVSHAMTSGCAGAQGCKIRTLKRCRSVSWV